MAKQVAGGFMIGTINGLSYYQRGGKFYVKRVTRIDPDRIRNAPEFARTRETLKEFKISSAHGNAIRHQLRRSLRKSLWLQMCQQFSRKIWNNVVKMPDVARGERNMNLPSLQVDLQGYDFNENVPMLGFINTGFIATVDRISGVHKLQVGMHNTSYVMVPNAVTHYQFQFNVVSGDGVDPKGWAGHFGCSGMVDRLSGMVNLPLIDCVTVENDASKVLIMTVTMALQQEIDGKMWPYNDGKSNPTMIIHVDVI